MGTNLIEAFCALAATGFLVGGLFAEASLRADPDRLRPAGWLYAADLAGGFAGALVGSLALVPFIGLPASVLCMIPLLLSCLALA